MPIFNALAADYAHVADFVFLYIVEAHASDEWPMPVGGGREPYPQPKSLPERAARAAEYVADYGLELPVYVDCMSNAFESAYAAWPERFFVIDTGVIAFISQPVPDKGHDPAEVEAWLQARAALDGPGPFVVDSGCVDGPTDSGVECTPADAAPPAPTVETSASPASE